MVAQRRPRAAPSAVTDQAAVRHQVMWRAVADRASDDVSRRDLWRGTGESTVGRVRTARSSGRSASNSVRRSRTVDRSFGESARPTDTAGRSMVGTDMH
jgi:hypothetical protein